jgi:hypothetical protein
MYVHKRPKGGQLPTPIGHGQLQGGRIRSRGPRARASDSPINHRVGGQSPTKRARRSAFPRSSWSTVFALIQRMMQRPTAPSEAAWKCPARRPTALRPRVIMRVAYPLGVDPTPGCGNASSGSGVGR